MCLVSVVIPVKNGDAWLEGALSGILEQTLADQTEIIVVDSGSTDGTHSILQKFEVRVINIAPQDFNHGATRNLGVAQAKGKYVVLTVQDAKPVGKHWLEQLVNSFEHENVAAACGQQIIPHDHDKNPVSWFRPIGQPQKRVYSFTPEQFAALSPAEKKSACSWDNVNAIYKREVLLQHPFPVVDFGEDTLWAREAYLAGLTLMYNPFAQVTHYHFEEPAFVFKREFTEHYHFYKFFGHKPERAGAKQRLMKTLRTVKLLMLEKKLKWNEKLRWLKFNLSVQAAARKATDAFYTYLPQGEQVLYEKYLALCTTQLQAVKPVKANEPTLG